MSKAYIVILDGYGVAPDSPGNAVTRANTPYLDTLFSPEHTALLEAHGPAVGLPHGVTGGSEVGHMTIGAGRVIMSAVERISKAIDAGVSGEFFTDPILVEQMQRAAKNGKIHLLGLLSDGGIHSHIHHTKALITMAQQYNIRDIFVHAFLDGRDTEERSAARYLSAIDALDGVTIASLHGRYYAMDRDQNWDRTEATYRVLTGETELRYTNRITALQNYYASFDTSDYYFPPTLLSEEGIVYNDDVCVFWNFRTDRMRQLCSALYDTSFLYFHRPYRSNPEHGAVFGAYCEALKQVLPDTQKPVKNTLGAVVSNAGLRQLRIAETEKYNHVTFFMNGEHPDPFSGEDRHMVASPKVANYKDDPGMSAQEASDYAVSQLQSQNYDLVMHNFANPDLVGHGADFQATMTALEIMNACVEQCITAAINNGYTVLITADHGNAEDMLEPDGITPKASHTTNPVPCSVCDAQGFWSLHERGSLADIAPTVLSIMGLVVPEEMTGRVLVS